MWVLENMLQLDTVHNCTKYIITAEASLTSPPSSPTPVNTPTSQPYPIHPHNFLPNPYARIN